MTRTTSKTAELLDIIRSQIAPKDEALKEARGRRDAVRGAADAFGSTNRTFASGSIAHRTANCPVHRRDAGLDADCGVVLDRRAYSHLGPDSLLGQGPNKVVNQMADHLQRELKGTYPKVKAKVTKRAILLAFDEPLSGGEDPTVDIVVGLDRAQLPGLWIPNTESDTWDPSHPEKHTELLTAEPATLRLVRQHAIRLAKAENKRTERPPLCSFNIEAFGWMFVRPGMSDAEALLAIWRDGAADLAQRLTPDPAQVSADIKVEDCDLALFRLRYAASQLQSALDHDDDAEWVRRALAPLFPEFVPPALDAFSKAQVVAESRDPGSQLRFGAGGVLGLSGALVNTSVRSFGEQG
ncbi:hypothetical protein NIE79_004934 [Micromonospora sp. NIE79]|uniref:Nucleotidyltransferase n=1 Tax=Micromonospora trifolii TaxID=2911208 RepID=A0ABS9N8T8_9ACTN|nr:hypothetical protein [Micromonospora trifolii]MCG5446366.1 hypothetical protein [Micromonospora trifolii]